LTRQADRRIPPQQWRSVRLLFAALALLGLAACATSGPSVSNVPGPPQARPLPGGPLTLPPSVQRPPGSPAGPGFGAPYGGSVASGTRVALLLPLSGEFGELGTALARAAELALFDVANDEFVLIPIDTLGTPEGARAAMERAIAENVSLVLGPLLSSSVTAVRDRAADAGLMVVSFTTDPAVAGNGVFVMGFRARPQVERLIEYAVDQGLYRFAVLAPDDAYGHSVAATLQEVADRYYASVTNIEFYDPATEDLTPVARRLADYDKRRKALLDYRKALAASADPAAKEELESLKKVDTLGNVDFDAVLLPEGGTRLRMVASLLSFYDVDTDTVRYLGTGQWDDEALSDEPTLRGGWFSAPPPTVARRAFEGRYKESFGAEPPRIATLAYDAVALAAALAQAEGGPNFSYLGLTTPNGFVGIDGIFRFRADGMVDRGLAVLEVGRRGFHIISPPPDSFAVPSG